MSKHWTHFGLIALTVGVALYLGWDALVLHFVEYGFVIPALHDAVVGYFTAAK